MPKSGQITPKNPNTILIYVPGLPPQEGCEKEKRIDSNIRKQIKEAIYHEVKLKKLIRSIPSTK